LSPVSMALMMRSQAASSSASNSFQRGGVTGVLHQHGSYVEMKFLHVEMGCYTLVVSER
jgi:hypothetical protein